MDNSNRIKDYLLNQLSEEERKQVEAEVRENDELALELELQRFEMETIDQIEADHLKKKAAELRLRTPVGNNQKSRSGRTIRIYRILAAAASIAFIIGLFFFWRQDGSNADIMAFSYQQARVEYTVADTYRGRETNAAFEPTYLKILQNREQNQASEAIEYFSNFQSDTISAQIRAMLNLGHAYLLNQDFLKAAETFEDLQQLPGATTPQMEEAAFFRAVALIKAGEPNSGREILEKLSQKGKGYDAVAKRLLNRISE